MNAPVREGTITAGEYAGWTVRVEDDSANTGGFLILITHGDRGFDDWVADESLDRFLEEAKWSIMWR